MHYVLSNLNPSHFSKTEHAGLVDVGTALNQTGRLLVRNIVVFGQKLIPAVYTRPYGFLVFYTMIS